MTLFCKLIKGDRLKRACKLAKLGIWEMDFVNNSFYSSDELFELYGLDRNERSFISFEEFFSLVHPEDLERVVREVNNALNNPVVSIMNAKYRFARLDGSFAYVHDRAICVWKNSIGIKGGVMKNKDLVRMDG